MSLLDILFGKPLATSEERAEHIGVSSGIPIFGLDGLTSAAYGPEAAMSFLIPMGLAGLHYILPVITTILVLLVIVYFSYRQTIAAYPNGGGSFTVATENLGEMPGLFAAAALMIDYILTAAVGVSAGVTAVVDVYPGLQPHMVPACMVVLAVLAIVNMRGVRETGLAFIAPTFLFVGTLMIAIGIGSWKCFITHGHPVSLYTLPPASPNHTFLGLAFIWMIMKTFSSGCAAMTGVEAVSNGVMAFREPRTKNAQWTLTVIIGLLIIMLYGTSYLANAYHIMAMDPDASNYQSMLSILVRAITGSGWFYTATMGSVFLALALSANTAFADFPRLTRAIALHDFLPHVFTLRGRRLLYSHGIYALTGFTALILIAMKGVTDNLIPLYAIGAFLAFTLSQAGMVVHWKKMEGKHYGKMFVNGIGAVATGITLIVVLISKFMEGAWMTAIMVPLIIYGMVRVKRHYQRIHVETAESKPLDLTNLQAPLVVIPMDRWNRMTEKAMRFGLVLSSDVRVLHVDCDEEPSSLCAQWDEKVMAPLEGTSLPRPQLVTLKSHFRFIINPLVTYILELEKAHPDRKVAVLLPELVVRHWWENILHNQRVQVLKVILLLRGNQRIIVVNIPWYL
jgi:amino acid transporter